MNYLLGTDIGTSGTKTILMDTTGKLIAQDLQEYDVLTPKPLWAEQWPDVWYEATKDSIRNTVAKAAEAGVKAEDIKGIAISGLYGGSGIPLDENMKPIRPCMIWMDRRADDETKWVLDHIGEEKLLEITHNGADPYYGYTKILWMKKNEPENFAKIVKIMLPKDYLAYRLSGSIIFAIRAKFSGSFSFTHRIFGAVKPVNAMFAVYLESVSFPITSFRYAVSFVVRPSFQRIAGRIT